jgi:M6 family metalloprotease-like protein
MKKVLFVIATLACLLSLTANYVRNEPFEYSQPDGTRLSLYVTGDEFYHRVHDGGDFTILLDPESGYAVYAIPDGNGIRPSEHVVGQADPAALNLAPGLRKDPDLVRSRLRLHEDGAGDRDLRAPTTGTINNLFIFVRFADQTEYTSALSGYDTMCNSTSAASLKDYFSEESASQLTISTTFYPAAEGGIVRSYQDSHNRGYFSPWTSTNTIGYTTDNQGMTRLHTMMSAAVASIAASVPSGLVIDSDGDGQVDNVTFVAKGDPDGWGDALWPHWWTVNLVSAFYINSKRVWGYNLQFSNTIDVGVTCHEMSHSLGFPDLYHYDDDGMTPVGAWDLMEWDQDVPQHHLAFMKWKYGEWFDNLPLLVPTPVASTYTLSAISSSPYACYKIPSNLENQYYVVEYRRKTGRYETSVPASGLIIYRVMQGVNGNADGPPDEVYIYRPNGTISVNGSINSAHFSSSVGRSAINNTTNPEPWLWVNSTTSTDGNLQISNIGVNTGASISFTVQNTSTNVWDGSTSTDWNTPTNWSLNAVPVADHYVEIPSGLSNYPVVTGMAEVKNVLVQSGASLTIGNGDLTANLDFDNSGILAINNIAGNLWVGDDLFFRGGSSANITANGEIYVQGDVEFLTGSSVNMTMGYLEFFGTGDSFIRTYAATTINNLRSDKNDTFSFGISSLSTSQLTINGSVWIYDGSNFTHGYSGTTNIRGNITCYTGGAINCANGTLNMTGNIHSTINLVDATNTLRHFRVGKDSSYQVILASNLNVVGNLTIYSGVFNPASYTIRVGGNWTNSAGTAGFAEGSSTVVLNGSGTQAIGTETFNNLELNKASGTMTIGAGALVTCASYNWTAGTYAVDGGAFTANDLVDPGIFGTIILYSGSIEYHQDTSQFIDLRADLSIGGGNFDVYGGNSSCYFSYVDVATLTLSSGGNLDFHDVGIYIPAAYAFNDNISGGIIRTARGFENYRPDFNPTNGLIELYGSADCSLTTTAGSNFHHLSVYKYPVREEEDSFSLPQWELSRDGSRVPLTRTNQVTASGPFDINGSFVFGAGTFIAPATMNVGGNWVNYVGPEAFVEGTNTVTLDGTGTQTVSTETFASLVLNKSAGSMIIPTGSTVTCSSYDWVAGSYAVSGGTFIANDLVDQGILGTINLSSGTIEYHQDSGQLADLRANLTITGGSFLVYGGAGTAYFSYIDIATLTMSSGILDYVDIGIIVPSGWAFNDYISGGTIRTSRSFEVQRTDFNPNGGTIELYGTLNANLQCAGGSNLYSVTVNKASTRGDGTPARGYDTERDGGLVPLVRSYTVTATSDLDLNGTLHITAGLFVAPPSITIAGHWENMVGPTAFTEGTGTVTFDGSAHQYCSYTENFNNLIVNKSGGALRVNNPGGVLTCANYTWVAGAVDVLSGVFTANDLAQNGIKGNFYVNPPGTINLYQDVSNWIDLDAFLTFTNGGTINIYGGSSASWWAYSANAGITMNGGTLNFADQGINIPSTAYSLTLNVTGGLIRSAGIFQDLRGGVVLSGGEVEMYGPGMFYVSLATGSRFNNLKINKTGTVRSGERDLRTVGSQGRIETRDYRTNGVLAYSDLDIYGDLTITAGSFDLVGYDVTVRDDLIIYGTLGMQVPALLDVWDDVSWQAGSVDFVNTGSIHCGGNWLFANGCSVNLTGCTVRMDSDYGATLTNNSPTASFGHLEIYAALEEPETIYDYTAGCNLLVNGDLTIYAENTLNLNEGICTVGGNTSINATGVLFVGDGGTFTGNGNLELRGQLVTGPGTAIVHGYFNSYNSGLLSVNQGIFTNDRAWSIEVVDLFCGLLLTSGTVEITNCSVLLRTHGMRTFTNATLRVGGAFTATEAGAYLPSGGSLRLIGTLSTNLNIAGGNYAPNFHIQKSIYSATVALLNPLTVTGSLNLTGGILDCLGNNISVGGSWVNTAGTGAFFPATATVTFNQSGGVQSVSGNTFFSNIMDSHTGNALDFQDWFQVSGTLTVNNIVTIQNWSFLSNVSNTASTGILSFYNDFDSTISSYTGGGAIRSFSSSHVVISELTQNGLYGSWTADAGHLEVHQDAGNWIDLNGSVLIQNNGVMDIYGGNMSCYFAYGGNASLTMSSGEFNVKDWGIVIPASAYACSFNLTGGTLTTNTSFSDYRGNFTPTGGTVKFASAADGSVTLTSPSNFHHIVVDKPLTREGEGQLFETDHSGILTPLTRSGNLNLGQLTVNGNLIIQSANTVALQGNLTGANEGEIALNGGTLNLNGYTIACSGNVSVFGTLKLTAGSILSLPNNKMLNIYGGGVLEAIGSPSNNALFTRNGASGSYAFIVESGATFRSAYTIYEYLTFYGLMIKDGAIVDPAFSLNNCTFRNGVAGGKLLTINNAQTLTVDGAVFPANTWSGAYNVSKTWNQGTVTFTNYSGDFSGPAYENDAYTRINWSAGGVPEISNLSIERFGVSDVRLHWTYAFPFDSFRIYASDRPEGPFSLVGTTTNTQWTGSTANPRAFYRVTVDYTP